MNSLSSTRLLDSLFTTAAMAGIFSERSRLQGMLDFEAALARAESRLGIIPVSVALTIETKCRIELFDIEMLTRSTAAAGNAAIPLLQELTALVEKEDEEAAGYVHWGATSQDAIDTGLILQLRSAFELIERDLLRLSAALAQLANAHKRTPLAGRTWLQQATPVAFGLKAAGWLSAIERQRVRLAELRPRLLVIQFGGAAGTLASLGDEGLDIAAALAQELRLALPDLPWHTQRDRIAEAATSCGLLVGSLGKMARDISLMMQTEVGEAFEPTAPDRGGSSTMPHKRNPVSCAIVLAAAIRVPALVSTMLSAMVQEHERGLGGWHAEWETLPEICRLTAGALAQITQVMEGLEIDPARMAENLNATHGLILAEAVSTALAAHIGRLPAHDLIARACRLATSSGRQLRDVLAEDAQVREHLGEADLDRLLDPNNYAGMAEKMVDRVLAARSNKR
jgi:3-carboxy-cis,cis-muconate cycloisomerase